MTHDHHVDNFDMTDDDLLNNDQLNAAWRRAGGLDHALLDDYGDPQDQEESSVAPAAPAADTAAAPALNTAAAFVQPAGG